MVSVIESSRGTLLVTSIGFVKLVAVCHDPTRLAAVGPSPITVAADKKALPHSAAWQDRRRRASSREAVVPPRKRDSTTAPLSWHAWSVSDLEFLRGLDCPNPPPGKRRGARRLPTIRREVDEHGLFFAIPKIKSTGGTQNETFIDRRCCVVEPRPGGTCAL